MDKHARFTFWPVAALLVSLLQSADTMTQEASRSGCAVSGQQCVCYAVSHCTKCDPFEIAVDREEDDPDWCMETGYKRRVHCVFTNSGEEERVPQDTYESCSIAQLDRVKYFMFEAMCGVAGAVFVVGANKRKALLYERIERRLRQQIDEIDVV